MSDLRSSQVGYLSPEIDRLARKAFELGDAGTLETSSKKTYTSLQTHYNKFCARHGILPFAPGSVMAYIAHCLEAKEAASTLRSRVAAIKRMAIDANQPDPTEDEQVRTVLRNAVKEIKNGKRDERGRMVEPPRRVERVEPLKYSNLEALVAVVDEGKIRSYKANDRLRLRDRALLLFCFALARRGAEIADLTFDDIFVRPTGWNVRFRWSKTNKSGEAEFVGVPRFESDPLCPIAAMEAYHAVVGIHVGALFRTEETVLRKDGARGGDNPMTRQDIARRVEKIAKAAGLLGRWRSHSFRRGFVTNAEELGVARSRININTGWKSDAMYSTYAQHDDKIAQSPLHEIYAQRAATTLFDTQKDS